MLTFDKIEAKTNKDVVNIFGFKNINGKLYSQSWCRDCRKNKANSDTIDINSKEDQQEIKI